MKPTMPLAPKWEHYKAGADEEALSWLTEQSQKDTRSGTDTNVRQMADPTSAVNINMGTLVGSYANVARMLDEVASVPGAEGVLLTFDDFLSGIETFGERIQPLMQCRAHLPALNSGGGMMTTLTARPEAITFDPQQSALIVVDMQNAYATPGGYLDLAGFDVSTTRPVIANIQTAVTAARAAGMLIIWFQNGWDEQYVEAGGPGSPNFHKSNALKTMRKQPQLQGKLLAKGSWDYQLVDELVPQPGDIVLPKPRYSGFFNTPLDSILRSRGIRHLVFTGIATNVCVESTLRDGFFSGVFRRGAGRRNTPGGA